MWQNERLQRKKSLIVLQNDYKHTGYDNDYKINLAISLISRSTCTHIRIKSGLDPCCPTLDFVFAFWIMITFDALLASIFYITQDKRQCM
jgi:hypothetical protein